jgi:MYXO-CTERM domain-containing protein
LWIVAVVLVLGARIAAACSPPSTGLRERTSFPRSAAIGVPTNVRPLVFYAGSEGVFGIPVPGDDLEMRARDGATVAIQKELAFTATTVWSTSWVIIVRPATPLRPGTTYDLVDRRPKIPCGPADCTLGPPAPFASFTTGAGPDNTPPEFGGLKSVTPGPLEVCANEGCCGPYVSRMFTLGWEAGRDDVSGADVLYNVYGADAMPILSFVSGTTVLGAGGCAGPYGSPFAAFRAQGGRYAVRAVDWAGNEDTNHVVQLVLLDCTPPADAGTDAGRDATVEYALATDSSANSDATTGPGDANLAPPPDAASADDAETPVAPPKPAGRGCACAVGSTRSPSALPLVALLIAMARRRERC